MASQLENTMSTESKNGIDKLGAKLSGQVVGAGDAQENAADQAPRAQGGRFAASAISADMARDIAMSLREIFGQKMRTALLYGSYARGDHDAESDVDVAVLLDMPRNEIRRYRKQVVALATRLFMKYDKLVSITEIPGNDYEAYRNTLPFYRNIAEEGVLLNVG